MLNALRYGTSRLEDLIIAFAHRAPSAAESCLGGLDVPRPGGAMYLWLPVPTGEPSLDLSLRLGVNPSALSKYETGRNPMGPKWPARSPRY